MRPYKRRKYIVDKDFQRRFILTFVLICLSGMVLALILFNCMVINEIEDLKWTMVHYEKTLGEIAMPHLIYLGIFAIFYTAVALSIASWVLTEKVAGPIYRLKSDIDRIGEGNLRLNVRLRKNDAFKGTAAELDRMVTALRERFGRVDTNFKATKKIVDTLRDSREELLMAKCEQLLHTIEDLNNSLKT